MSAIHIVHRAKPENFQHFQLKMLELKVWQMKKRQMCPWNQAAQNQKVSCLDHPFENLNLITFCFLFDQFITFESHIFKPVLKKHSDRT